MPNLYNPDKRTIGSLLSMTSPAIRVPDWQRNYSWTASEVETFWVDLNAFSENYTDRQLDDQEYFLGSVVLVNEGRSHLLLDGQQRLATATILLSVIRDNLYKYNRDAAVRTSHRYIADMNDATGEREYKLTLNSYDRDYFRREIQDCREGQDYQAPSPTINSHRLIRKARQQFEKHFERQYNDLGAGKVAFDWALRIQRVLTEQVSVVAVSSTDEDNAANVFETLNDRGIGLSTPDLLRNLLLRRARQDDLDDAIACWKEILDLEDVPTAKVDLFIRHQWLSKKGDVKKRSLYREIKADILQNDTDSLDFSRELAGDASTYSEIVQASHQDPEVQRLLLAAKDLGAKMLFPTMLSGFKVGNLDQIKDLLQSLIALFVRHNVIGGLENSALETKVFEVAKELRESRDFPTSLRKLKEFAPDDEDFIEKFKTAEIGRASVARYLLRALEHEKRKTGEVEVLGTDRVTLEHVYPKRPRPGPRMEDHESVVDRIGNQTLLAKRLNEQAKNAPFDDKRKHYEESEILITQDLLDYDEWDLESINDRQEKMSELVSSIWSFPDG
jgi:uncharacterized protein with ParB-like and HNH nuclease domain